MSSQRPSAVQKKGYIEIDLEHFYSTGEVVAISDPIVAPTITTKIPKGKFEIVYTAQLFGILEKLGNRKIQVLNYLLDQKDGSNCLNMTNTEISKNTGVSRKTVVETMNVLSDAGLISRKNSVIMLSPNFVIKGNRIREAYLMQKFEEMQNDTTDKLPILDSKIEGQLELSAEGDIVERVK